MGEEDDDILPRVEGRRPAFDEAEDDDAAADGPPLLAAAAAGPFADALRFFLVATKQPLSTINLFSCAHGAL